MFRKLSVIFFMVLVWQLAWAQAPGVIPYSESEPIEFTPFNIILYIVSPVLIFVIYFIYRNNQKKKRRENNSD